MDIRILRYFLAVVREESISGAAESLHLTQPTLSRQLMDLEDELGVKLLNRGKKNQRVTLTEEGMLLRRRAEEIVALTDKTISEFDTSHDIINGDIYIGGGETNAMRLIARVGKKLQSQYPFIRYHLFSGNADDVAERLDKGLLDFGLFIEPASMERYNYLRLPDTDTWGLLIRKDSVLAAKESIRAEDLETIPLIVSRQSMVHNELSGWSGSNFDKLNIVATYNLIYNASLMVDEGFGYALCLDRLVFSADNNNFCFRPLEPRLEAHVDIAWKKYQVFSKAAGKFLEALQDELTLM